MSSIVPVYDNTNVRLYCGDALEVLKQMDSESVNAVCTSPPYWALRNYGVEGAIGNEPTIAEYVERMVEVFAEVRRVLRKDGTCWVNLGDTYASAWSCGRRSVIGDGSCDPKRRANRVIGNREFTLKEKDRCMIPARVALALQADGWWLRDEIIWHKPNPMPSSVTDRTTPAHEMIYLLTKSARYAYNAAAIRTNYAEKTYTTFGCESKGYGDGTGLVQSENWGRDVPVRKPKEWKTPDNWDTGPGAHGSILRSGREKGIPASQRFGGPNSGVRKKHCPNNSQPTEKPTEGRYEDFQGAEGRYEDFQGANARSVWTFSTKAYPEAHFATFPEELPKRCILAGCPPGGTVLDPFAGSGTTLAVALALGRNGIGIELNGDYCDLARERISRVTPSLFQEVV